MGFAKFELRRYLGMSRVVRKSAIFICENKDADKLRGNRAAELLFCFHLIDSTTPLLSNSEISNLWPSSEAVYPGLCRTWSETSNTDLLAMRLKRETTRTFQLLGLQRYGVQHR